MGETPYFVTMVELDGDQKFIILGQENVFFVDNSLRKNPSNMPSSAGTEEFKYSDIKKIKYYRNHRNFFKLQLIGEGNPQEMQIISQDTPNLINSLKCYWQIDHMKRFLSYRELRIDIADELPREEEENNNNLGLSSQKNTNSRHMPIQDGYKFHMQNNYKFALKKEFEQHPKKKSQYVDTNSAHNEDLQNATDI